MSARHRCAFSARRARRLRRAVGCSGALVLCALLALSSQPARAASPRPYVVTPITAPGGFALNVTSLNDSGHFAGEYTRAQGGRRAFILREGQFTDLGTLGGASSAAYDINNAGDVVGVANVALSGAQRAFLYSGGRMRDLGSLGGDMSVATALNERGQVVGYSTNLDGLQEAFLYSDGRMVGLGSLEGGRTFRADDINEQGQVIGRWRNGFGNERGFLYQNGTLRDLGTLGGGWALPAAINDAGQVVGSSARPFPDENEHAFLYSEGAMRSIEPAPGLLWSAAADINNGGAAVGNAAVSGRSGAFLWRDGVAYDINALADRPVDWLHAINQPGRILASGCIGGACGALLLTPVPEPGAAAMLLAGLGALLVHRRRRGWRRWDYAVRVRQRRTD